MRRLKIVAYDARSAINALYHAGITAECVRWGDVIYVEVKPADAKAAHAALRPWLLPTWWQRAWLCLQGQR
jgi:hypothetical protein